MWLSNSSVGRKFVMALTGAFLIVFVTFHCLMNAVAIIWPAAYNSICEFLGANWYALAASLVLAVFVVLHIILATVLTVQNRKARGNVRYAISKRPATVEWSSRNMFVLGVVVVAFLVVHLIQFWSKMQLREIMGSDDVLPPAAGTLFLQEAFQQPWTLAVYAIGFVALWFHLTHGFWSMFQSVGWNNTRWMGRLKCISNWWVSIVCLLFLAQGVVFTVRANEKYYLTNEALREQYKDMIIPMIEKDFGPDATQLSLNIKMSPYQNVSMGIRQMSSQMQSRMEQMNTPEGQEYLKSNPEAAAQQQEIAKQAKCLEKAAKLFDYLESADNKPENNLMPASAGQPY